MSAGGGLNARHDASVREWTRQAHRRNLLLGRGFRSWCYRRNRPRDTARSNDCANGGGIAPALRRSRLNPARRLVVVARLAQRSCRAGREPHCRSRVLRQPPCDATARLAPLALSNVRTGLDPYDVLGVAKGADQAAIHDAYRTAVRRAHPDAGGSAAAFEAVQEAYELLRDPARRRAWDAQRIRPRARATPSNPAATHAASGVSSGSTGSSMEDLLAESRRLENEARRLAGLPTRDAPSSPSSESGDSVAAIVRDAAQQLRDVAAGGTRELRRRIRRVL